MKSRSLPLRPDRRLRERDPSASLQQGTERRIGRDGASDRAGREGRVDFALRLAGAAGGGQEARRLETRLDASRFRREARPERLERPLEVPGGPADRLRPGRP